MTHVLAFPYSADGVDATIGQAAANQFAEQSRLPVGTRGYTTGDTMLADNGAGDDSSTLFETLNGAAAALVVLAFVFGSFLAVVPLIPPQASRS